MRLFLCIVGFISFCGCTAEKLPSYIQICSLRDPNFNSCTLESARLAFPKLIDGEPKLGLPPLQPMSIPEVALVSRNNLKLVMTDLKVFGMKSLEILDFRPLFQKVDLRIDTVSNKISSKSFNKQVEILAHCSINGQILFFPLNGSGPCKFTFIDGNYDYNLVYALKRRSNGKNYLQVNKELSTFTYSLGKAKFDLEKLFGNNQELGKRTNQLINDNWKLFNEEMRPSIEEASLQILINIIRSFMKNIPADELILS